MLSVEERQKIKETIKTVLACAYEVFEDLGEGWSEVVYQKALEVALREKGIRYESQVTVPIYFKNEYLVGEAVPDLLVWVELGNGKRVCVVVELKCTTEITRSNVVQVQKYIKALERMLEGRAIVYNYGVIINFQKSNKKEDLDVDLNVKAYPDQNSPLKFVVVHNEI